MSALMVLNVILVMAGAAFVGWAWRHHREVGIEMLKRENRSEEASK